MKFKKTATLFLCGMVLSTTGFSIVSHAETNKPIPRKIVGTDDRVKITDTTKAPYSSIVYIQIGGSSGTGTVIGKNKILTAGHVADNLTSNAIISKSFVTPARNGGIAPYGSFYIESADIHPKWSQESKRDYDIAVITVKPNNKNQEIGQVVPIIPVNPVPAIPAGSKNIVPGYGGDKKGEMWEGRGTVLSDASLRFYYDADTIGGNSGGPVFNNNFSLIGVHTAAYTSGDGTIKNGGTKLTDSNYALVEKHLDKVEADIQAPTQVTGVSASKITKNSVQLAWKAATDNIGVDKYEIYRDGTKIAESETTTWTVAGLTASTAYRFSIAAVDAAGNRSKLSASLTVQTEKEEVKPEEPLENETTWEKNKVYTEGNTVFYKGIEYRAKWWTQGDNPGIADVWEKVNKNLVSDWDKQVAYQGGSLVIHKGIKYKAKWWTRGDEPGKASVWVKN